MQDLAKAYVQIVPSAEGIKGSLEKVMSGEASSAGKSAGGGIAAGIKGAIVKAGIGVAVGKVIKESVSEGAALEQSIGGIETLFGNQGAKTVQEYANMQQKSIAEVGAEFTRNQQAEAKMMEYAAKAYETAGLSRNEYMEQATSFSATLLQGLEGDTLKAAEYADKAMIAMSDNSNKFGTDIESIQNAYQGFAKDNYMMLDNLKLGYGGTNAEMARLINDSGVLGDEMKATASNVKDIPFDKVIEAIDVTQQRLGIAGTTSEEAAKTFSGSFQSMAAAAKNALGSLALGEDMEAPLKALASSVVTFAKNLIPMLGNVLQAIPGTMAALFQELANNSGEITTMVLDMVTGFVTAVLENLPTIISSVLVLANSIVETLMSYDWSTTGMDMLNRIIESITTNLPHMITMGLQLVQKLIEGLVTAIPQIIAAIPVVLGALFDTITTHLPEFLLQGMNILRSIIDGIVGNIGDIISAMTTILMQIVQVTIENLPMILQAGIEILLALISGVLQAIPQLLAAFVDMGSQIGETITSIDWIGLGADILEGIIMGVVNGVGKLVDAVKSAALKALDTAKSALGIHSPSAVFRDQVGKQIDLGIAGGIEDYANPIKNAMNGLSDMTQRGFNAASQLMTGGAYSSNAELAMAGVGNITVPVYIGNTKMGQAVANANQTNTYRSGGR